MDFYCSNADEKYRYMFLMGFSFYSCIIELPQRFQSVNGTSAARAGILLLALTLITPVGAMISGLVMGRYIPAEYIMIIANIIILIGVALLSTLPVHHPIPPAEFGYEVIMGAGLGLASPPPFLILKTSVAGKDIGKKTPKILYPTYYTNLPHSLRNRRPKHVPHARRLYRRGYLLGTTALVATVRATDVPLPHPSLRPRQFHC
jgi:MFS family permease